MKKLFVILTVLLCANAYSQKLELSALGNQNVSYYLGNKTYLASSDLKPGFGYSFLFAVDDIKFQENSSPLRISIQYDYYSAHVYSSLHFGMMSSEYYDFDLQKSQIMVGIYPFRLEFLKNFQWNIGLAAAVVISDSFEGTKSNGWLNVQDLQENPDLVKSNPITMGLSNHLSYKIPLSEKLSLSAQYQANLFLINEFSNIEAPLKSFRHALGVGVQYKL